MMKRTTARLLAAIALIAGLLGGLLISHILPDGLLEAPLTAAVSGESGETGNTALVTRAMSALEAIRARDYAALSAQVDPELGVTFTPMATVDPASNLTFSASQIASAAGEKQTYVWGTAADTAAPISLTISDYFDAYVWDADYTAARQINVDTVMASGNALENVQEAYPDCRFVEFYCSGGASATDWQALKLVYRQNGGTWYLVGVIHSAWTA